MTKRSRFEQRRRAEEQARIRQIEDAWRAQLSTQQTAAFGREVELALARVPVQREDMAPGTRPNPPRPGREPREPEDQRTRRSWI